MKEKSRESAKKKLVKRSSGKGKKRRPRTFCIRGLRVIDIEKKQKAKEGEEKSSKKERREMYIDPKQCELSLNRVKGKERRMEART